MAMLEIRNVQKTFRSYARPGLFHRPGARKVASGLPDVYKRQCALKGGPGSVVYRSCCCHIRVHIRAAEGNLQYTSDACARLVCIRPQR